METNHNEVADVLDGAADVIERDGWWGGESRDVGTCASNAMQRAWKGGTCTTEGFIGAHRALIESLGRPYRAVMDVFTWNDAPERTEQEVLDALRHAAKDQRRLADGIES